MWKLYVEFKHIFLPPDSGPNEHDVSNRSLHSSLSHFEALSFETNHNGENTMKRHVTFFRMVPTLIIIVLSSCSDNSEFGSPTQDEISLNKNLSSQSANSTITFEYTGFLPVFNTNTSLTGYKCAWGNSSYNGNTICSQSSASAFNPVKNTASIHLNIVENGCLKFNGRIADAVPNGTEIWGQVILPMNETLTSSNIIVYFNGDQKTIDTDRYYQVPGFKLESNKTYEFRITHQISAYFACSESEKFREKTTYSETFGSNPPLSVSISAPYCVTSKGDVATWTANPSGGTGSYSYYWTPGGYTTKSISRPVSNCPTIYTVTVTSGTQNKNASKSVYYQNPVSTCGCGDLIN